MDNEQLLSIVSKIKKNLKYKYLGSFPADMVPFNIEKNSFCIINSDTSTEPGTHWVMIADRDGILYFGDSLGRPLDYYRKLRFNSNRQVNSCVIFVCRDKTYVDYTVFILLMYSTNMEIYRTFVIV